MKLLTFILLLIFLCPTLNVSGIPVRIEDLMFIGLVSAYPILLIKSFNDPIYGTLIKILILFFISNIISLIIITLHGYSPGLQDINSILLIFRNIIILCAGIILGQRIHIAFYKLIILFLVGPLISSVISLIQYFNLFGIAELLFLAFSSEERMLYGITRAVGVFGNPNYAAFFQLSGFISLLCIPITKKIKYKFIYYSILLICALSILVTFSRTGLITLVLVIFIYFIIQRKFKSLLILILLLFFAILNIDKLITNTRYSTIIENDGVMDETLGGRSTYIWDGKLEQFAGSPFFGIGPAKDSKENTIFSTTIYDNSYIYLLVTCGLIGFLIMTIFFLAQIRYFYLVRRLHRQLFVFIILLNIAIGVFFITTDLIKHVIFTSFFYFLIGMAITYIKKTEPTNGTPNFNTNS